MQNYREASGGSLAFEVDKFHQNYHRLNKFILEDNNFGTLYHYDYLSKLGMDLKQQKNVGAMAYARFGDYANAIKSYKSVIKTDPSDWESQFQLATIYMDLNDMENARLLIENLINTSQLGSNRIFFVWLIDAVGQTSLGLNTDDINKVMYELFNFHEVALFRDGNSLKFEEYIKSNQGSRTDSSVVHSNNHIEMAPGEFDLAKGITFEAWVKRGSNLGWGGFIANYGGEGPQNNYYDGFSILEINRSGNSQIRFEIANTTISEKSQHDVPIMTSGWYHLACTWDRITGEIIIYINGERVGGVGNFYGPIRLPNRNLNFGRTSLGWNGANWEGGLSEVRLWNYAKGKDDLLKYSKLRLTKYYPGLVGYWPMDEGKGNDILSNYTTNKQDGVFVNPNWKTTNELPFSDVSSYVSFEPDLNEEQNASNSKRINWFFLESYAHLEILKGNVDLGIKIIDFVRFQSSDVPAVSDEDYYTSRNPMQFLKLANAYLRKGNVEVAKRLVDSAAQQVRPSSKNFNHYGIRYESLERHIMNKIKSN